MSAGSHPSVKPIDDSCPCPATVACLGNLHPIVVDQPLEALFGRVSRSGWLEIRARPTTSNGDTTKSRNRSSRLPRATANVITRRRSAGTQARSMTPIHAKLGEGGIGAVDADTEQAQRVSPNRVDSAQPERPAGQCHTNVARVEVVPHRMDEEDEILPAYCRQCTFHVPVESVKDHLFIFDEPLRFIGG